MRKITQLSEEEILLWIRTQLEKREFLSGRKPEKEKLKETLYEILFLEQKMTVKEIEQFFIPFGQAGFLTPRQKFELMLYILEKDYGNCCCFLDGAENYGVVTEEDIEAIYKEWLKEERIFLTEEEKKEFFVQSLMDQLGLGVMEVLNRVAPDGILLGEFCPEFYGKECPEKRIAVCSGGVVIRLPFLAMKNREELIRIVRCVIAKENKRELSIMEPMLDFVKEDGTCITAVRPPVGKEWGIRILFGAARKRGCEWKN